MFLLIDNYDSFTYNLFHYLGEIGAEVKVVRNDKITVDEILNNRQDTKDTDNYIEGVILSPGPKTPSEAGICTDLIKKSAGTLPIFGVCLGHQSIGQVYNSKVIRAPYLMHGKVSDINHNNKGIFKDLKTPLRATRYHSLIVEKETLSDELIITAWSDDGLIMGLEHKEYPLHGVQFHPESIESECGHDMMRNFINIAREFNRANHN
jgi:anthranilate synthase component 2